MGPDAERLAEAHRLAQLRLGGEVLRRMLVLFALLNPSDLDATFDAWLVGVLGVVAADRAASAALAANYLTLARQLDIGPDPTFKPTIAKPATPDAISISMLVTGPAAIRAASARGVPLGEVVDIAKAGTARAAMRHVLDGGRQTIMETVAADPQAKGWSRHTSGKACKFCSMLAGRGAVYTEATADFQSHDGCSCAAVPVFG